MKDVKALKSVQVGDLSKIRFQTLSCSFKLAFPRALQCQLIPCRKRIHAMRARIEILFLGSHEEYRLFLVSHARNPKIISFRFSQSNFDSNKSHFQTSSHRAIYLETASLNQHAIVDRNLQIAHRRPHTGLKTYPMTLPSSSHSLSTAVDNDLSSGYAWWGMWEQCVMQER